MAGKMFIGNKAVTPVIIKGGSPEPEEDAIGKLTLKEINGKKRLCIEGLKLKGCVSTNDFQFKFNGSPYGAVQLFGELVFEDLESVEKNATSYLFESQRITKAYFPNLLIIKERGFETIFMSCTLLREIRFPLLETLEDNALYCFVFSTEGVDIYFDSLKNVSKYCLKSALMMVKEKTTVHFPSNMEQTISQLYGYPTFDGDPSLVTLSFDLPPTE